MANPALKRTSYIIKAKCKRAKGETVSTATRTLDNINEDYIDSADNADALIGKLQPLITDTITGFTLVTEREYQLGADIATIQPGINEWEDDLDNMKLVNYYTSGDDTKKESITYPSTDQTPAKYKAYADERSSSMGNWSAMYGDIIGTSDTKVWQAD